MMLSIKVRYSEVYFSRRWRRWLLGATMGGLFAVGSAIDLPLLGPAAAYAQTVTNEEIRSYAESVIEMDSGRLAAYTQISDIITSAGYDVADYSLTCPNAQSLELPRQVRSRVSAILVEYCNSARTIVEENGLTVRRFNAITEAHRSDSGLAQRIQAEIASIQQ